MTQQDGEEPGNKSGYLQFIQSQEGQGLAHATGLITRMTLFRIHMEDYIVLLQGMRARHNQEMSEMRSRLSKLREDSQSLLLSDEERQKFAVSIKTLEDSLKLVQQEAAKVHFGPREDSKEG